MGYQSPLSNPIRLPVGTTPDTRDADLYAALAPIHTSLYTLANAFMRFTGIDSLPESEGMATSQSDQLIPQNLNRLWVKAAEDLVPGHIISVAMVSGELVAYKATAANPGAKIACGVYHGDRNVTAGANAEVWLGQAYINRISGIVAGQRYFLASSSPGLITLGSSGAGNYCQYIGFGLGPNALLMNISAPLLNDNSGISTGVTYVTGR